MVNDHRATKVCRTTTNRYKYHTQLKLKPTKDADNAFIIFHQNICGLPNKHEELLYSLTEHPLQIICLTEHHLHDEELEGMTFSNYTLGAKFCRKTHKGRGVCTLIKDNLHFASINIDKYSKEMDIEICAIKIYTPSGAIVVMTVYRSTGDVTYFLNTLETALDQLYNNTANIILCGDFNINYLSDNKKKQIKFLVN
jgi:exonuclease III